MALRRHRRVAADHAVDEPRQLRAAAEVETRPGRRSPTRRRRSSPPTTELPTIVHVGRASRRRAARARRRPGPMSSVVRVTLVTRLPVITLSRIVIGAVEDVAAPSRKASGSPSGSCADDRVAREDRARRSSPGRRPRRRRRPRVTARRSARRPRTGAACWSGRSRCPAISVSRIASAPPSASRPPPSAKRPFGATTVARLRASTQSTSVRVPRSLQMPAPIASLATGPADLVVADDGARQPHVAPVVDARPRPLRRRGTGRPGTRASTARCPAPARASWSALPGCR